MRDYVTVRTVVKIVYRSRALIGAPYRFAHFAKGIALLDHLSLDIKSMHINLGTLFNCLFTQVAINAIGSNCPMADRRGQQMGTYHIATYKKTRLALNLVVFVTGNCTFAVIEFLQAREIDCLTDRRDNQIRRNVFLRSFDILDLKSATNHLRFAPRNPQRNGTAIVATHNCDGCHSVTNSDAFRQGMFDLVFGGLHFVNCKNRGQSHFGALARRCSCNIVRDVTGNRHFWAIRRIDLVDVSEAARNGCHIDGCIPTTHHNDTFANVVQPSVVECLEE